LTPFGLFNLCKRASSLSSAGDAGTSGGAKDVDDAPAALTDDDDGGEVAAPAADTGGLDAAITAGAAVGAALPMLLSGLGKQKYGFGKT
jgi:hypothetical protein